MIVLAIDTATTDLVAGLVEVRDGDELTARAERVVPTRSHNELLVPTVLGLLADAGLEFSDLGAVVVGCGPGPFTGLRVGMATASAFGQALGIPVHGVCTHDAVASLIDAETETDSALVVTDARRREVYWAQYRGGERVAGPDVVAPAALRLSEGDTSVEVLSVPENLRDQLSVEADTVTYVAPRPVGLVAVADLAATPEPLVPLYLRRPDAKEPAPKPKSPAIPDIAGIAVDGTKGE
ncbi:tRNA (adenosine(37)-N6)-threonylcarbamoyltransferase complex dimerization subunit type 1 TsaB [Corynebacterium urinipleomorphum]|uniref:tRNA (adenosine(37)-N6)-threonylcarbamoyltransferase complex dimerization subunit type 1 TsaB n=1 Tax=Corynebacterium urinipleomorphum TaxID=1852380 RepID=UPI000B34AF9E|nr:tRNA (adenosine(37)-N6)-threonylcarbamoyltransferase complex dimerization subunit type 1 TsaB [Corynebacterium urinipleomorphum]